MKKIFSRRLLFLHVALAVVLLYLAFVGFSNRPFEEQVLRPLEAKAERDTMGLEGEGMVDETKRRRKGKAVYILGHRKERVKKKVFAKEKSNRDVLPSLEPSGGSALLSLDLAEYSPEDRAVLTNRLGILRARASALSRVCSSTPALFEMPSRDPFLWDTKHTPNIVWCPVYKVASTTWMNNFFILANRSNINKSLLQKFNETKQKKEQRGINMTQSFDHKLVRDMYPAPRLPEERAKVLKNSMRVIIVRHPFTRILSAYRDKMLSEIPGPPKFNFKELQSRIVKNYRKPNSADNSKFPSFPEFVQFVIDSTKSFNSSKDWIEQVKCWLPYWVRCSVCSFDYNVIMKLETIEEDKRFLVTLSRLHELRVKDQWVHLKNATSSSTLAAKYYKQLTRRQILQLYERYEPDFKLFQYDVKDYLDNAKDSK
ncbi:carbohydrate sulfotransferase 11-like [Penaeus monodon]|uniref:carbohydrate sulfotransferase 11-like n=1 Tax=Penaeus monodon TaxID=6687 RepID=UPI0018A74742|nr:carbohydrate sulfotransferase 11-like [Penaeus monodon]XP_037797643.1 carbohydrate sulfotransferase 11-like [Penaeus monodon]